MVIGGSRPIVMVADIYQSFLLALVNQMPVLKGEILDRRKKMI